MYRVVDELYCMCELESNIDQCEVAARILSSCREDFINVRSLCCHGP